MFPFLTAVLLLGPVACSRKSVLIETPTPDIETRARTGAGTAAASVVGASPEPTPSPTCAEAALLAHVDAASLAQAQAIVPFPLLVPTTIPAGYRLMTIDCQRLPTPSVHLEYAWPDGPPSRYGGEARFNFWQGPGFLRLPQISNDPRFNCLEGTAIVQGQPAVWQRQQYNISAPDDVCKGPNAAGGRLTGPELDWVASGADPAVGYRLQSDDLTLDQLMAIADSMQPYGRP